MVVHVQVQVQQLRIAHGQPLVQSGFVQHCIQRYLSAYVELIQHCLAYCWLSSCAPRICCLCVCFAAACVAWWCAAHD
jgi:hypothetical protein